MQHVWGTLWLMMSTGAVGQGAVSLSPLQTQPSPFLINARPGGDLSDDARSLFLFKRLPAEFDPHRWVLLQPNLWSSRGDFLSTFNWNSSLQNICPFSSSCLFILLIGVTMAYFAPWFIVQCHCYLFSCWNCSSFSRWQLFQVCTVTLDMPPSF